MRLLHRLLHPRQGRRRRAAKGGRRHGAHRAGGADLCAQRGHGEGGPDQSHAAGDFPSFLGKTIGKHGKPWEGGVLPSGND